MKINLMTDYAVRVIRSIYKSEKGIVTSNYIARTQEISHGVLMKVLRKLRENKIIVSHQGRGEIVGGYSLGNLARETTFLDIIEIMEGAIMLENIGNRGEKKIGNIEKDEILKEYQRYSQVIREEMKKHTLYEILDREVEKQ
jgi:Predicted transcriptional regulator